MLCLTLNKRHLCARVFVFVSLCLCVCVCVSTISAVNSEHGGIKDVNDIQWVMNYISLIDRVAYSTVLMKPKSGLQFHPSKGSTQS